MDERRVADYFVVAGLPDNPEPLDDFSTDGINLKPTQHQAPITDIAVIFRSLGESPPSGFNVIDTTVSGLCADLNHGSIRSPNVFLCYRRGRDKPPLVDIGVLYEGKERLMADSEVILVTPYGRPANVNNSGSKTFITYRRASPRAPCNELVVTDICVILSNKGEVPPHTFCIISKNLNKGMVGSDVYLCYKKSMNRAKSIVYKPAILDRFPTTDYDNFPLPPSVPLFCLPVGATIECWPARASTPKPVFSTFVLTSHTVEKVYGAAVTFYERYTNGDKLTAEQNEVLHLDESQEDSVLSINKCICILSRWPFFETFEQFLTFLHDMSLTGPHCIPIERFISHFMLEVPFPSPQRPRILIQLNNLERMSLAQPDDSPLPLSGASFQQLLKNLGPDNCLLLLLFALTEQKILIHSLRPDVLTSVAEAVSMLIFPFHWQCPYIPLCPLGLSDVLSAPMAFIVGVDSRFFDLYDPPNDVTCVDLDTNSFSVSEEKKNVTLKLLPKKPARALRNSLQMLCERMRRLTEIAKLQSKTTMLGDRDAKLRKEERAIELEIQEAFLRFTASVLKGFRSFLQPITKAPTIGTTDCSSLFDIQGFLKSRDKAYHRFYSLLTKTQMFTRFIEERSFVSDKDVSLAFFDDCTEKVDTGEYPESRLLELDESHRSERTVFISPPEPIGLPPDAVYSYSGFMNLSPSLYHEKHQLKTWNTPIIKASLAPGSPLAKRSKQEIRSAQQNAKRLSEKPDQWSKCLVSYCYTLWFIHLPAFVKSCQSKPKALQKAYDILVSMPSARLHPPDEVCYRVLMQLCGQYSQPVLAVKLLSEMKRNGVQPNAITYGYYNKAVLESTWPACSTNGYLLWNKLRNVIIGVALFKRGTSRRPQSTCYESDYDGLSRGSTEGSAPDVSIPGEGITDPKPEDGASTGCQSDVGYNSMNTDETQKSSSSISSQLTTNDGDTSDSRPSKSTLKDQDKVKAANRVLKFDDVDFTESDHLRTQLRSIVRSSVSSLGSSTRAFREVVDSSAGILITGRSSLYDNNGDDIRLRWRKRHRSASDFGHRSSSHYHRTRHQSEPESTLSLSRRLSHDADQGMLRSDSFGNDAKILTNLKNTESSSSENNITEKDEITEEKLDEGLVMMVNESGSAKQIPMRKKSVYERPTLTIIEDESSLPESETSSTTSDSNQITSKTDTLQTSSWFDLDSLKNNIKARAGTMRDSFPKASKVTRSATFCHSPEHSSKLSAADEAAVEARRLLHRSSSTLPHRSPSASSLMSPSFSSLTSLKLAFNQSPRKSDILGSLKSAANSMATKLNEIKEAISASGTPTKALKPNMERKISNEEDATELVEIHARMSFDYLKPTEESLSQDEIDALINEAKQVRSLSVTSPPSQSALAAFHETQLNSSADKFSQNKLDSRVALEVIMSSCSRCHTCNSLLYDEEIMIGWTAEDSNLNTRCQFCTNKLVPFLIITIKDHRVANEKLSAAQSEESMQSAPSLTNLDTRPNFAPNNLEGTSVGDHSLSVEDESSDSATYSSPVGSPHKLSSEINGSVEMSPSGVGQQKSERIVRPAGIARTLFVVPETGETNLLARDEVNNSSLASSRASSVADVNARGHTARDSIASPSVSLEPISVPYLSPIVLRKELENVLDHEGDACLNEARFVDEHPIIYWNLIWFFERISVPSHLTGLSLVAQSVVKEREIPSSWSSADSSNIVVRCIWDNVKLHEDIGNPMYILWGQNASPSSLVYALVTEEKSATKELMQQIVVNVADNDLVEPLKLVLNHIQKKQHPGTSKLRRHSIYRDILFLIIVAFGRENISISSFDREYRRACDRIPPSYMDLMQKYDKVPSVGAILCRQPFRDLSL